MLGCHVVSGERIDLDQCNCRGHNGRLGGATGLRGHARANQRRVHLLGQPPSEQHHSSAGRRRNDRRHQPAAERKQHSDVIADERAGDTH